MHDLFFQRERMRSLPRAQLAGSAQLELISGVAHLRPEDAMFDAMLRGWRAQQTARGLKPDTIESREQLVRRVHVETNEYPWGWGPAHVDEWVLSTTAERRLALSTLRSYQVDLRLFTEYVIDSRYGWVAACEKAFGPGVHPVAVFHEWNSVSHLDAYEGQPEARPFSREELQAFFDYADDQVELSTSSGHKGALTAYRDATVFKLIYAWGMRRTEATRIDLVDWATNPAAPEFGSLGSVAVRYGKAKRGGPPRRRTVLSLMGWAVEAVADYIENIRPRFGAQEHPAMFVTERGGRLKPVEVNARFVSYRDALGLPKELVPHSLRHAYVTHLTEDGVDRRFLQVQVGHECDTSTAIYTHVSDDFMNTALRRALSPALGGKSKRSGK